MEDIPFLTDIIVPITGTLIMEASMTVTTVAIMAACMVVITEAFTVVTMATITGEGLITMTVNTPLAMAEKTGPVLCRRGITVD
jgi:hypothetical protein